MCGKIAHAVFHVEKSRQPAGFLGVEQHSRFVDTECRMVAVRLAAQAMCCAKPQENLPWTLELARTPDAGIRQGSQAQLGRRGRRFDSDRPNEGLACEPSRERTCKWSVSRLQLPHLLAFAMSDRRNLPRSNIDLERGRSRTCLIEINQGVYSWDNAGWLW